MSKKTKAMKTLRRAAKQAQARAMESVPWAQRLMLWTTMQMAERGKGILDGARERLGVEPMSGHVVDMLMNGAARMEAAALSGNAEVYEEALIVTLFFARHLAYQQGKMAAAVAEEEERRRRCVWTAEDEAEEWRRQCEAQEADLKASEATQ